MEFVEDAGHLGEWRVAVGSLVAPGEEERVTSHGHLVSGVGREVAVELTVGSGREHVGRGVEVEEVARVAEDDGVEHDVFVDGECDVDVEGFNSDTLGEGLRGTGAKGRFGNRRRTHGVRGDQRIVCGRGCRTRI